MQLLKQGSIGPRVHLLRRALTALEFGLDVTSEFDEITRIAVRDYQRSRGLGVDGVVGPKTWAALVEDVARFAAELAEPEPLASTTDLTIDEHGWLIGGDVTRIAIDESWFGGVLDPQGVVCHVSATNPGTAINMARRRTRKFGLDPDDRLASWHASIETDGSIVQMVPFSRRAHHAGSPSAQKIPGLGWANSTTLGIELIGWERGPFPPAQVEAYARVLRAIVRRFGITREHAMITHASIDPGRRSDPGPVWTRSHADHVLEVAFAK